MTAVKKLPRFSLFLLLLTYSSFGWIVATIKPAALVLPATIILAFLISASVAAPLTNLEIVIVRWLRSDIFASFAIALAAFLTVIILNWIHFFSHVLILVSAASLARLDFQIFGLTDKTAFWILNIISLFGIGLGWVAKNFLWTLQLVPLHF